MRTDSNGDLMDNQAELIFNQANGATFKVVFFDSDEKWAIDQTNATLLHICTKIVSEADYYAAIGNPSGFQEFITNISTKIMPQAAGKTSTINKTNPKYDIYAIPAATSMAAEGAAATPVEDVF